MEASLTPSPQPIEVQETTVPQSSASPEPASMRLPEAAGVSIMTSDKAIIDYSNVADGYVMVQRLDETDTHFKVQVTKDGTTYTYDLMPGGWTTFPLSEGDGTYGVTVYENAGGSRYATVVGVSFDAVLTDEFAPFLIPNTYVNYTNAVYTIQKANELAGQIADPLGKVDAVYSFVIQNITYDYLLASTVQSGYIPDLDTVLGKCRGICFDYASLMTAMLRLQGVPCKLIFGYVGEAYHAWIRVWSDEEGWIDAIFFDGRTWQRMDPTFAASGKSDESIRAFTGDGKNYAEKYSY